MKIRFFLLLAVSIVISVMLSGCNKDNITSGTTGTFKDNRDGKTYKWVKIGKQVWMAENLNYTGSGTHITDDYEWLINSDYDGWCYYENDENNSNTYGVLYQWEAAKIACPAGWHLPTNDEWTQLENYLMENGFSYDGVVGGKGIAKSLATDNGWTISDEPGAVGNTDYSEMRNKTGFSALPGGLRIQDGHFIYLGSHGRWCSATEYDSHRIYSIELSFERAIVHYDIFSQNKLFGFSVRCVKNKD